MFADNFTRLNYNRQTIVKSISDSRINPFIDDNKEETQSVDVTITSIGGSSVVTNHFNKPTSKINESTSMDELEIAIKECKQNILSVMDNEELKNQFIIELVELNKAIHTKKELNKIQSIRQSSPIIFERGSTEKEECVLIIAGHRLERCRSGIRQKKQCEVCRGSIHTAVVAYRCAACPLRVHQGSLCVGRLSRACPASNLGHPSLFSSQIVSGRKYSSASNGLNIDIENFPLVGSLLSQNFLCAECNCPISPLDYKNSAIPPRYPSIFCNYNRKFYCPSCHWGNKFWIPSVYFMLNTWKMLSVCRSAYLKLKFSWNVILFRQPSFWEKHNSYASEILRIRLKMFRLRFFIRQCNVLKSLVKPYSDWLIEQPYLVTMQLVYNISNGSASNEVYILFSSIIDHIPGCEKCKILCHSCVLCDDRQVIYPRPGVTWSCSKCCFSFVHESCGLNVFHSESDYICRKCSES